MNIKTFTKEEEFIKANLEFLKGAKYVALSGGSTPASTYRAMQDFAAEFFQVDERYVPADHPDSNQKMIHETLQQKFHHFDTSLSIEDALTKYENEIADTTFDACILGIGPDGHTASLFPHSPALHSTRTVAHSTTDEFAVHDRLTLTFSKILASKKLLVLLKNKEETIEKLKNPELSNSEIPAKELLKHPSLQVHHLKNL